MPWYRPRQKPLCQQMMVSKHMVSQNAPLSLNELKLPEFKHHITSHFKWVIVGDKSMWMMKCDKTEIFYKNA